MVKQLFLILMTLLTFAVGRGQTKDTIHVADGAAMDLLLDQITTNENSINDLSDQMNAETYQSQINTLQYQVDTLASFCTWLLSQIGTITPVYPYAPYNLDTTEVNTTSIAIAWDDSTTSPDSFRVDLADNATSPPVPTYSLYDYTTNKYITISGLTESTPYAIRVFTVKGGITSNTSNILSVLTDATSGGGGGTVVEGASSIKVDKNATGLNDGTTWTNAYNSFASISWTNIGKRDGVQDTIYVAKGTYTERITIPSGHYNFVLRPAVSDDYKGTVLIDGENARGGLYMDGAYDSVTVYGLKFDNCTGRTINCTNGASSYLRDILFEKDTVLNFQGDGIFFEADGGDAPQNSYAMVKDCYFNDKDGYAGQSDGIYAQVMKWFRASGNTVIINNPISISSTTDYHSDNMQTYLISEVVYDNNYYYYQSDYKGLGTQLSFMENMTTGDATGIHLFYNNVLYRDVPNARDGAMRDKAITGLTDYVFNNTFIGNARVIWTDNPKYIYNNLVYERDGYYDGVVTSTGTFLGRSNNLFYDADGVLGSYTGWTEDDPLFSSTTLFNYLGWFATSRITLYRSRNRCKLNININTISLYFLDGF